MYIYIILQGVYIYIHIYIFVEASILSEAQYLVYLEETIVRSPE